MLPTLPRYNPSSKIMPRSEHLKITQAGQATTFDCGNISLWTGLTNVQPCAIVADTSKVVEFLREYQGMLECCTHVLISEQREPTQAVRADQIRQLTRAPSRTAVPLALRTDAFRAEEVLDELRELREKYGPEFGRAKRPGRRIPLSE
jgi:hypothetical protein